MNREQVPQYELILSNLNRSVTAENLRAGERASNYHFLDTPFWLLQVGYSLAERTLSILDWRKNRHHRKIHPEVVEHLPRQRHKVGAVILPFAVGIEPTGA